MLGLVGHVLISEFPGKKNFQENFRGNSLHLTTIIILISAMDSLLHHNEQLFPTAALPYRLCTFLAMFSELANFS